VALTKKCKSGSSGIEGKVIRGNIGIYTTQLGSQKLFYGVFLLIAKDYTAIVEFVFEEITLISGEDFVKQSCK